MTILHQSLLYAALPAVLTIAAGSYSLLRKPGDRLTSMVQHFAAGLVFAVVAVELLPDIVHQHVAGVMLSFALGVAAMLGLKKLSENASGRGGFSFLFPVGVDLLLDGLLIGIGFAGGLRQGQLLGIALGVEGLSLGLALGVTIVTGRAKSRAFLVLCTLSSFYVMGAAAGSSLLAGISKHLLADALSFGSAALLYLVTEELLVEAHEKKCTSWTTVMFFAGFAGVELLEMLQR
jgi:ZIP family zinc transporter